MIPIKSRQDIDKMQSAGHILAEVMDSIEKNIKPGITTIDLDKKALKVMSGLGVKSAFKGYRGFPANICVSVNEEVVHGIPDRKRLSEGDIVSVDIGIERDGFFVDMAKTFPVGKIDPAKRRLLDATEASLFEAIKKLKPNAKLGDVSCAVQNYVEPKGFSVVRDFVGHGIGRALHEEPQIPNFKTNDSGPTLKEGMVLAIEPMINLGSWEVEVLDNGWTAVTKDKKPSAHFEHTVAIRDGGPVILTQ